VKNFLVYRHGSNKATQSMTPKMAVCIVEANDDDDALRIAAENVTVYNNQFLEAIAEDDLTDEQVEDWNDVSTSDAERRGNGEGSIIFTAT
jgi:hypothetical protein